MSSQDIGETKLHLFYGSPFMPIPWDEEKIHLTPSPFLPIEDDDVALLLDLLYSYAFQLLPVLLVPLLTPPLFFLHL